MTSDHSGPVIVRTGRGPSHDVVTALAKSGVATAHEAFGRRGLLGPELRPIYPGARIAGRAVDGPVPSGRQPHDPCLYRAVPRG